MAEPDLPSHARAVVIGGGIVGCSVLYHLAKLGWRDAVLLERAELTSGSTWHAAGNTPHYNSSLTLTRIHMESVALHQRLERETGQSVGFHKTGSLRLASVPDRMDEYRWHRGRARAIGLAMEIVDPAEIKRLHPLLVTDGLLGAAWHPEDGHVDPSSVTQALAQGARAAGARVLRGTKVLGLRQRAPGEWEVRTDRGVIVAETVVNAGGTWAREIGALVGLDLPIVPMEHQYIVFDAMPEVMALEQEPPIARDVDVSYYLRQERQGMLLGPYERTGKTFGAHGVPPEFGADLLPPDLDRIADIIEAAMRRMPALATAGIKKIVNGPITYTPDGNPLLGPAPGLRNHWLACGFSFGITQAGGCGKVLAEWIVEGAPSLDAREIDPRRYGRYADLDYAIARCTDIYENEYAIAYPFGETSVARRVRVSPVYPLLAERGAVFGTSNGWEVPLWFAKPGEETKDAPGFRGSSWFAGSLREVHLVRERVGVLDQSSLAKIEISGPDAERLLARAVASPLPREVGDLGRALMLTPKGGILADATLTRLAPDRYFLTAAAAAELRVLDALQSESGGETVRVENMTEDWGAFVVAGPKAHDTLTKLATGTLDRFGFPAHSAQEISIADKPVRALEFDRAGEIGWTLAHRMEDQILLYRALLEAGAEFGIRDFGHRAMNMLRLEHNHPAELDLGTEMTPLEAGLEGLVDFERTGFIGREALLSQRKAGPRRRLVMLEVDGLDEFCRGGEAVFVGDRAVGLTTSGGQGSWVIASLAFATIEAEFVRKYAEVQVDIFGERRKAWILPDGILDPGYQRPKS